MALANDDLAPVVLQRCVESEGRPLDSWNVRKPVLQFAIHGVEFGLRVRQKTARSGYNDPVIGLVAEILMLHFSRLRVSSPAPASRTTDSVACTTTRTFCESEVGRACCGWRRATPRPDRRAR